MTHMSKVLIDGIDICLCENGFVVDVTVSCDGEFERKRFIADDKDKLGAMVADFIGQMPTPGAQQKETRQ